MSRRRDREEEVWEEWERIGRDIEWQTREEGYSRYAKEIEELLLTERMSPDYLSAAVKKER